MSVLLFEDEAVSQLFPATIGKAAFGITCGSFRLIDLIARLGLPIEWVARPHLSKILEADLAALKPKARGGEHRLFINAAMVPSIENMNRLAGWLREGQPGLARVGQRVVAALVVPGTQMPNVLSAAQQPQRRADDTAAASSVSTWLAGLGLPRVDLPLSVFDYPHDIVRHHLEILDTNLACRLEGGSYREIADGVFAEEGAVLGPYVVTDSSEGPILIDAHARIGPYCYISGPVHIGHHARVIEHAAIKDAVSLGHTTKIGGEIEASIIEPYTNKQHHGFLGHSYLGSWINLGAGTCNSDLKNTYGTVRMEYQGKPVETGMQFIGAIIGDYAKSAINTGIFTGKTIGACSMLYGFVTTNVPSFVNYARLFGQVTETPVDVMIRTQARMFARRNVVQRECDTQLLHDMYELTRHERQLAGEPLIL